MGWMADLIPGRVLNRYWGRRQQAMYLVWTLAYLAISAYTYCVSLPVDISYPILVTIAVLAGVIDILLFLEVKEPPNKLVTDRVLLKVLFEPLQDKGYRRFVIFSCVWFACVMFTASFMQLYVLQELGLSQWATSLIWCAAGVGQALSSAGWGRLADRHGQRPILNLCTFFKPSIVLVFFFLTRENVLWLLPLAFVFDAMLNAGNAVATNGYMMKIAPRANRPMFMAAIIGCSGLCGGLASIVGGMFLDASKGFSLHLGGREWTHFHLLFLIGFLLRVACMPLVRGIREPKSSPSREVLDEVLDAWYTMFVRVPVGLFRRIGDAGVED
jgi:predicted MFS family arabinose efflux permease